MNSTFEPIAIVGVAGLFPGARDFAAFWENIVHRRSASQEIPDGRWPRPVREYYAPEIAAPDRVYSTRACLLDDIPFDPASTSMPREWFEGIDPVFRLTLQVGTRAWADCRREAVDPRRVGVILANIVLPTDTASAATRRLFGELIRQRSGGGSDGQFDGALWSHPLNRFVAGAPAGLLAHVLGLGGGSRTLDAACASSLYSLKLACDELHARRADAMLAGGVSRPESMYTQMGFSQLRALSPTGIPRPLDARADGIVVGEGAGMFVLKRLADAVAQGDKVYGVIRGVGLSNDRGGSLLAPDSEGQLRAMGQVYRRAGWRPWDVDLIECHATGTPVGDATEIRSLQQLWREGGVRPGACGLGSVKSNVGHLLTAAGAASLMKILLGFAHETLPPTANFEEPNAALATPGSPFRAQVEAGPWRPREEGVPLRAAVSAFGFGGINAHLLVEDFHGLPDASRTVVAVSTPRANDAPRPQVALVGIDVRIGPFQGVHAFRAAALSGESGLREAPDRVTLGPPASGALESLQEAGRAARGAWMDAVEVPLGRFRIPPRELEEMLPQQLLMLLAVDEAMRDAGGAQGDAAQTGVFIGIPLDMNTTNFFARWSLPGDSRAGSPDNAADDAARDDDANLAAAGPPLTANRVLGALGGMTASRIARELRAGGPSFTLSAEENSGLRALEVGVRALQGGEIDTAVVGAVDLGGDLRSILASHAIRSPLSADALHPLSESPSGSAAGEGAVAFVLRRLDDARRDGQRVYALVEGLGFASGGDGTTLTASGRAWAAAASAAHREAGVAIGDIGLMEVWGSGFAAEETNEALGILGLFDRGEASRTPSCALAGLQAVVGNTGAPAGLAAVARAALCLHESVLPRSSGMLTPRQELKPPGLGLFTSRTPQYWFRDRALGPRVAAISCMTLDGNAAHVVLAGAESRASAAGDAETAVCESSQPVAAPQEALFALEGDSRAELLEQLYALTEFLLDDERVADRPLHSASREWWRVGASRRNAALGLTFVARNRRELVGQFEIARVFLEGSEARRLEEAVPVKDRIFFNPHPLRKGGIAFVFPGSGNQYVGMGADLGARWPHLIRALERQFEFLASQFAPARFAPYRIDWSEGWEAEAQAAIVADHRSLIFGHVSHSALLSDVARQFGLEPSAVIGYSLGETAGYFASRAWNDRDEMMRRVQGSTLFTEDLVGPCKSARAFWGMGDRDPLEWRVGVVDRSAAQVRQALKSIERVYLLIVNTPQECVIGGEAGAVAAAVRVLGCSFFALQGISTVHCEVAKPVRDLYRGLHLFKTTPPPGVRFYSGAFGRSFDVGRQSAADSIVGQAITGFEFPRVIESAYEDGVRVFLEMGPQASCSRMIGRILGDRPHVARSICLQGQGGYSGVLRFLARLIAERVPVDLAPLFDDRRDALETGLTESRLRIPLGGAPDAKPELIRVTEPEPTDAEASHPIDQPEEGSEPGAAPAPVREDANLDGSADGRRATPSVAPIAADSGDGFRAADRIPVPMPEPAGVSISEELIASIAAAQAASAAAHETFLKVSQATLESQSRALQLQLSLLEALGAETDFGPLDPDGSAAESSDGPAALPPVAARAPGGPPVLAPPAETPRVFDRARCLEFARGKIVNVLGPAFAEIDTHPTRVRLPDAPLMLVDRITATEGEPGSLGPGRLVTEHDVRPGGWYLDGGRMAPGVTIEAGQADLFLCAYLGIDFETKGIGKYRLLDAAVTYHRGLPRPGEVIRYDIRIERFARQGSTHLFFFNYDGTINGEPLMTMRQGCAGFFSDRQLDEGRGLVLAEMEQTPQPGKAPADWEPPVPLEPEAYDEARLNALRAGDLAGCFGPAFAGLNVERPCTLPSGDLSLIDRVTSILPGGGRYGLGSIRAEKDIDPNAWFLTCHFVDDPVMPGTLMYESSLQALRVLLLRMGWIGEADAMAYEPRPGVNSRLRCRGQVKPGAGHAAYEVSIKELGFGPEPYAIADTIMYADGRPIVLVSDISIQLTGLKRTDIDSVWSGKSRAVVPPPPSTDFALRPGAAATAASAPASGVIGRDRILSYTNGSLVHAFGERYHAFDEGRFIARLPQEPFLFLDRVTRVDSPPWELVRGGEIETEFDVDPNAWYFTANRQPSLPFSVLLEYPLQSCGWFSAYMGSALKSSTDLFYRNLGGRAVLYEDIGRDAGTLTAKIQTTNLSSSAGMLIQSFSMTVFRQGRKIYLGDTSFGFFSKKALAQQVGVRGAAPYQPTHEEVETGLSATLEGGPPESPEQAAGMDYAGCGMPATAYRMIDRIDLFAPNGGPNRLGFIRGSKPVNPADWFFQAHFYQDPVWPGSLGLEAFLQLLKFAAHHHWGDRIAQGYHFEPIATRYEHEWIYRGQVIPANRDVTVEAVITRRDDEGLLLQASGFLKVDGLVIYEMKNFAIRAVRDCP